MSSSKVQFSIEIEKLKAISPDISFIDLITEYCETNEIDLHSVPQLITETLKQKIQHEAKVLNLIDNNDEFIPVNLL